MEDINHSSVSNAREEIKLVRERTHTLANTQLVQSSELTNLKDQIANLISNDKISNERIHVHDLLIERIDSALRVFNAKIPNTLSVDISSLAIGVKNLTIEFEEFKTEVTKTLVSRLEFEPIKKIVYGMVGLILTAVTLALIGLVVIK